jgi:hypothetical protein
LFICNGFRKIGKIIEEEAKQGRVRKSTGKLSVKFRTERCEIDLEKFEMKFRRMIKQLEDYIIFDKV